MEGRDEAPWNLTDLPRGGDEYFDELAAAKGRSTSNWEMCEIAFSRLFAVAVRSHCEDIEAAKAYGEAQNFKGRLSALERVMERHFRTHCNQTLEGDFEDLTALARNFSLRRNEVVHSVIRPVMYERSYQKLPDGDQWTSKYRFFLVPPDYTARKFDKDKRPLFIYTSQEVNYFGAWFSFIPVASDSLARRMMGWKHAMPYGRKHSEPPTLPCMEQYREVPSGWSLPRRPSPL